MFASTHLDFELGLKLTRMGLRRYDGWNPDTCF
jgi:hypothetical protein